MYLDSAMFALATMLDYAVNVKGQSDIDAFFYKFVRSPYGSLFEKGYPAVVSGKSGVELYCLVTNDYNIVPYYSINRTAEYWLGWSLAYYQWYTNTTFINIASRITLREMLTWYSTLHEADISVFINTLNQRLYVQQTNLKYFRERAGLSQQMLSQLSGVPLHTIQLYEQRASDLSKAQFNILYALARVLKCTIYDLTEQNGQMYSKMTYTQYAPMIFRNQLNQRITQNNLQLYPLNVAAAQQQAYAYSSQFPYDHLQYSNNAYQIPCATYCQNWNKYWWALLNRRVGEDRAPRERKLLAKIGLEVLKNLAKEDGNMEAAIACDALGIIIADDLAEAISKAISIVNTVGDQRN